MSPALLAALLEWLRGLRFPTLAALTAAIFVVDLVVPDLLPFVDELLLGLATVLLASWRKHRAARSRPPRSTPIEHER